MSHKEPNPSSPDGVLRPSPPSGPPPLTGWRCPNCGRGNSPSVAQCVCGPPVGWIGTATEIDEGTLVQEAIPPNIGRRCQSGAEIDPVSPTQVRGIA